MVTAILITHAASRLTIETLQSTLLFIDLNDFTSGI